MQDEFRTFVDDILLNNPTILCECENPLYLDNMNAVIANLKPFECPDMYSKVGNTVYIIEHFAFDATKETSKGMKTIYSEKMAQKEMMKINPRGIWLRGRINGEQSFSELKANFERHFTSHYEKICHYKDHLRESNIIGANDTVVVCFWAQQYYPPYITKDGSWFAKLLYFRTKQFWSFFSGKKEVDFMLFSDSNEQLYYIDRTHSQINLVDIERKDDVVIVNQKFARMFSYSTFPLDIDDEH